MRPKYKRIPDARGTTGKLTVIGAVNRKGNVIARVTASTDTKMLDSFVHEVVSNKVSLLNTDEHSGYRFLGRTFPHEVIRKSTDKYVVGAVHTNTIEGFWSLIKARHHGQFPQGQRERSAAVRRGICIPLQQPSESRHLRNGYSRVLRRTKLRNSKRKRTQPKSKTE